MPQSIIIYRNPLEAAFWESGILFPLIVGMVVALVMTIVVCNAWERFLPRRMREYTGYVAIVTAVGSMLATMMLMK